MSEYYESMGSSEDARYTAKLEAVGLTLEDDLHSKESGRIFESNMTSWPPLDYYTALFLSTLITRPDLYSLEQLLS